MKVIDRLCRIPRMIGNVYLIVEPGGLTLIDAGAERRGGESCELRVGSCGL